MSEFNVKTGRAAWVDFRRFAVENDADFTSDWLYCAKRYFELTGIAVEPQKLASEDFNYKALEYAQIKDIKYVKVHWNLEEALANCLIRMSLAVDTDDRKWFDQASKEYNALVKKQETIAQDLHARTKELFDLVKDVKSRRIQSQKAQAPLHDFDEQNEPHVEVDFDFD